MSGLTSLKKYYFKISASNTWGTTTSAIGYFYTAPNFTAVRDHIDLNKTYGPVTGSTIAITGAANTFPSTARIQDAGQLLDLCRSASHRLDYSDVGQQ